MTQQSWLFLFTSFLFSSYLFCVFLSFFFSFGSHLVGFILVWKDFRKAFRILGLDERKGRWVVKQNFHWNVQINVTWFFGFFSGALDWISLIVVWFERSCCPWPLKLMTSQAVEGTWICVGGYRPLRGEWVNNLGLKGTVKVKITT